MPRLTLIIGILLATLGVVSYILTDGVSLTAMIPSAFGVLFIALALMARKESLRRHAMHFSVGLAMVGFLGGVVRAFVPFVNMIKSGTAEHQGATIAQVIMALLCLVLVAYGIRSFVEARRNKPA